MYGLRGAFDRVLGASLALILSASVTLGEVTGALTGQVTDESGAVLVDAKVIVVDSNGVERIATTNERGVYLVSSLESGRYRVTVQVDGFAPYEKLNVEVSAGRRESLNITLTVAISKQEITVGSNGDSLSTAPDANRDALVFKEKDLESLPEDPEELVAVLQAMAGPAAGPNGGQIFIDGFSQGTMPSKAAIREIRVNQNPFAAENDRMGLGRIDVVTRAGSDAYHGNVGGQYNHRSFNTRNPFSSDQPAYNFLYYGGSLSGPVLGKKRPLFVSLIRREIDDNSLVNATVLDPLLEVASFNSSVITPRRHLNGSVRFDYQLNQHNSLMMRYNHSRFSVENAGVGGFSLPSRAHNLKSSEHIWQVAETAILSPMVVNQSRFQFVRSSNDQRGDNSVPTILVQDAFIGGGSQIGLSFSRTDRWELQNYTTWSAGKHTLKFGARLRGAQIDSSSSSNFGGTYTFLGGVGPVLDSAGEVVRNAQGEPIIVSITSLERYRRTLVLQDLGFTPLQIAERGGGATYLTIVGGEPVARVSQVDVGAFFQADWRLRPTFTFSYGLRYERQNNIDSAYNFAPRLALVWAPGAGASQSPRTVIRGGFGIFYERFGETLTLQARRFNGVNQQQFYVADPRILGVFPNVPSSAELAGFAVPQDRVRVAGDLSSPYTVLSSVSIERQLPHHFTATAVYMNARGVRYLRSRNVNAPLPGGGASSARPLGDLGNVFEYESTGTYKQHQLLVSVTNRLSRSFTLFGTYALGNARSDTDGAGTFPANGYDLSNEFGRASLDFRHRAVAGGSVGLPWSITLNPLVVVTSGAPFNIVTGIDANGDTLATERPAFATDLSRPGVRMTRFGAFDLNPLVNQGAIPRNYGTGPSFLQTYLQAFKMFRFSSTTKRAAGAASNAAQRGTAPDRTYVLTVGLAVSNVLNRTNAATPVGNLSSPLFGQSTNIKVLSAAGLGGSESNRRIDFQIRLNF